MYCICSYRCGGIGTMFSAMPPERLLTTDFSTGLGDGGTVPFWGFLFGGLFLYVSYYGTDQKPSSAWPVG